MDSRAQFQPQPITEDDIAHFLATTPGFFERYAGLLASVQLGSPHSGRAISLQERQVELLRRKIHDLELRLAAMLRLGRDNVGIADKLLGLFQVLLSARSQQDLPGLLLSELERRFQLPQVALRLWDLAPEFADLEQAAASAAATSATSGAAALPDRLYCGPQAGQPALAWLAQPEAVQSVALLPLRPLADAPPFGLLVLASDDPQRFQPSMDTDFLRHLAELAGAALSRLLPVRHNSAP
ncbi:DUF484 domain-containing protein [Malikia spinosa]|uniref:DUF484 domain-containing protein n=1 Tax=Malikia spinosa TaxID=86180 RepID=A0A2S9KDX5_9BURK|nr:DUF484 family protein [Malikia spinosa]PRD68648.1 DUF484 domain-containing protein [Malikia spinosa]